MVLAGLMMPAVAQEKMKASEKMMKTLPVMKASDSGLPVEGMLPIDRGTLVNVEDWVSAGLSQKYDLQCQGGVYPMIKLHDDNAFMGCVWTTSDIAPWPGNTDGNNRNVGYAYSTDGGLTWSEQENRLGGIPVYWPSYAQWGPAGEAVMARSLDDREVFDGIQIKQGMVLFTRETRGTGEWTITPIPYPADADSRNIMAWGSLTTSGDQHQYIHIISPMSNRDIENIQYHGYNEPVIYYRTQDGKTWEVEGQVVPEMVGEEWSKDLNYSDGMSWAVQGNTVVCSFIGMGDHGYVIRSHNNGETWECIKFFDNPVQQGLTNADYGDSVFAPNLGTVALDNNGKIHIAFSAIRTMLGGDGVYYNPSSWGQFLSYWNEDMGTIDGDADFNSQKIVPLLMGYEDDGEYFDWELSDVENNLLYVKSTIPKWPVIGYFIPVMDDHIYTFVDAADEWAGGSYFHAGCFTFPQMTFDASNILHLAYLGLLDGKEDDGHWFRHPFYTTSEDGGQTWTQTEYLVNTVELIDREFAYLSLAGNGNNRMYLMAQVDVRAGTHIPAGTTGDPDHAATDNHFTVFPFQFPVSINEFEKTSLTMTLFPNPAAGQVTVQFEGKGNITVYNMLGQTAYHAENVENMKQIPLNNMTTGVYFVTVRSGNAVATQKLVVR